MDQILILTLSYLIGAIPFGVIIGKYFGKNPQNSGSGNIGATNVVRLLGKKVGATVFALDLFKCFALVLITRYFYTEYLSVLVGCTAVIGHIFPIYLGFKGGKGISSLIGLYFGLNYKLGIAFILAWLLIFKIFRYSFLSSIISSVLLLIGVYAYYDEYVFYPLLLLTIIIIFKHSKNISRFINKKEFKF
jgi:glycerol-3-phosphate acyltransferase PlsY